MELTFQAATPAERLYTARQSTQIAGQKCSLVTVNPVYPKKN